jgi:hypothetical protein
MRFLVVVPPPTTKKGLLVVDFSDTEKNGLADG